jgi:hypothetical protein
VARRERRALIEYRRQARRRENAVGVDDDDQVSSL